MKKLLLFITVLLLFGLSVFGQTTYTHSPTSQSSCPSSGISNGSPCGLPFLGGLVKMYGTTGSQLSLTISKCGSGSALNFGSTSSYYIKWSTTNDPATIACSNNTTQIYPGTGTTYTYTNANPGFTSGTRYYMLTVTASDGTTRYYSNVVAVSASATATNLSLSTCISISPGSPTQGGSMTATATVRNNNSVSWSGNLVMQLLTSAGAYITDLDLNSSVTLNANGTNQLSFSTANVTSTPGNYQIRIQYQNSGSSTWTNVSAGSCTNPVTFTVQAPATNLSLSTCISISPGSPTQGGSMTATATVRNNNSVSWSGNLVMQLLTSAGAYITDLDLNSSVTLNANGTNQLSFSTANVTSTPGNYQIRIQYQNSGSSSWVTVPQGSCSNPLNFTIQSPATNLSISTCISVSPSSPTQGSSMAATATVRNYNSVSWSGNLVMQLLTSAGAYITDLDLDNSLTIAANGTYQLSFSTSNITSTPGNYQIRIQYQNSGSSSWVTVPQGSCSNPLNFTIQSPGTNLSLSSCIPITPSSPIQGSSMTATATVRNNNSVSWSGNLVMQLLTSAGAYITDLDLDNSLTIAANGTYQLSFSTASITSTPGNYQIRIQYQNSGSSSWVTVPQGSCTNPVNFTIQSPGTNLSLSSCISITPSSPIQGGSMTATATVRNNNSVSWSGNLVMQLLTSAGAYITDLDLDNSLTIAANGTYQLSFSTASITSTPGNYQIRIQYQNSGSSTWVTVPQGSCTNPVNFTIQDSNCSFTDCSSTSNCGINSTLAYPAVQYLCNNGIVSGFNGTVLPDDYIKKSELAKVAYLGLFGGDIATVADNFPSPFNDLQDPNTYYHRYAKALSYLEYGDGIAPFDRDFFNFFPTNNIKRKYVVKVLLETFNLAPATNTSGYVAFSDVTVNTEDYWYIVRAQQLNIITGSGGQFRPDDNATRAEVFIMLHRILTNGLTLPTNPSGNSNFFIPGNYTPSNFSQLPSLEEGNFNHYVKSSFNIPGRNVSLDFAHTYNSMLTELPNEFFKSAPLGIGWKHTYNAYITAIEGATFQDNRALVHWPEGSIDVYTFGGVPVSVGLYDEMTITTGLIQVKKKNQVTYSFTNQFGYSGVLFLSEISDRFGNKITINYEQGVGGLPRISSVSDPSGRQLTFTYVSSTNLLYRVTDPANRLVQYSYSNGKLVGFRDAKNQNATYSYGTNLEEQYLLKTITLPKGNVITNSYLQKKLTSTKFNNNAPTNVSIQRQYVNSGLPSYVQSTVTTPQGVNYVNNFNQEGQLTQVDGPPGQDMDIQYNNGTHTTLPTYVSGNTVDINVLQYDAKGNPLHVRKTGGSITTNEYFTYNGLNDITSYTDPRGNTTSFQYNNGALSQITDALGNQTTMAYNNYGLPTSITNPSGVAVNIGYNNNGNQSTVSIPALGLSANTVYDAVSRVTSSTDFNGQSTTYAYDNNDNLTSVADPMGHTTSFAYDPNDNMTGITNALGRTTQLQYYFDTDWMQQLSFQGDQKAYTYNADGTIASFTSPNGVVFSYGYDGSRRVTNDSYATYSYDSRDNLQTVSRNGKTVSYNYDGLNRPASVSYNDFGGNTVSYGYDLNGNITTMTYPGNKTVTYTYDANNRMISAKDWNNSTTTYNYRPDGQLNYMQYPNLVRCTYSYDNAGRMTDMVWKRNSGSGSVIASYNYALDNLGNHLNETMVQPQQTPPVLTAGTTNYAHNNSNRTTTAGGNSLTFDDNGNTLTKTGYSFVYDTRNNMTSVSGNYSASYEYDGLGNRRTKTQGGNTTRYVLNILGMSTVLMETDAGGAVQNYYTHGLGLTARIDASGNYSYYIYDSRGSTVAMVDGTAQANVTHSYQYDEFGNMLATQEANFNPFRYVGKYGVMYENDKIYFMRARYYDPEIGRFLSEDPIWHANLYPYADNNPIMKLDPSGLTPDESRMRQIAAWILTNRKKIIDAGFTTQDVVGMALDIAGKDVSPVVGSVFAVAELVNNQVDNTINSKQKVINATAIVVKAGVSATAIAASAPVSAITSVLANAASDAVHMANYVKENGIAGFNSYMDQNGSYVWSFGQRTGARVDNIVANTLNWMGIPKLIRGY